MITTLEKMGLTLYQTLQKLINWFTGSLYDALASTVENGGVGSTIANWILNQWADGVPELANLEIWQLCIGSAITICLGYILFKWLLPFFE